MKFIWKNKEIKVNLTKYIKRKKNKSSLPHKTLLLKVEEKYPLSIIIQEFPCLGLKPILYLDIFLPNERIAFEVDGDQHDNYNNFFFKNKQAFFKAKANDRKKEEWCLENSIELIRIKYNSWNGEI